MGIIVGIVIVVVLALIVAATAGGGDQLDSMNPYYGMGEESLAELDSRRRSHDQHSGPGLASPDYFDRLMTPGSDEDAWHNAALDEGHDPENW